MKKLRNFIWSFVLIFLITNCDPETGKANFFSVQDDINLGMQVRDQILSDPQQFPILPESQYSEAYNHLRRIRDKILNSGKVVNRDNFAWEVRIVRDDNTLNAFVTPGGYIFVYTGLMKYLDTEDQLAGVMAHEIAHADRRHSTRNLTKQYGFSILLELALGSRAGSLAQVTKDLAGGLAALKFSRGMENEADEFSVEYLSATDYQCNGAAGFFEKIIQESSGNTQQQPVFLSTHPASDTRVHDINKKAERISCTTSPSRNNYQSVKNSLP